MSRYRNEWRKIKTPVLSMIVGLCFITCILSCTLYRNYSLTYDIEAWEVGTGVVNLLFPLLVVLPICQNMYYERKHNFLIYTLPRMDKKKYLGRKWLVYAFSAFCILVIPYILSAVFALFVKPSITPWPREVDHVFWGLFTEHPLIYAILLSIWRGVLGILVMSMGFVLSLYVDNIFVILTGPFIYSILENFTWAILGKPEYRLCTAFDPTIVVSERIHILTFVIGPGLVCLILLLLWFYFGTIKKTVIYKI